MILLAFAVTVSTAVAIIMGIFTLTALLVHAYARYRDTAKEVFKENFEAERIRGDRLEADLKELNNENKELAKRPELTQLMELKHEEMKMLVNLAENINTRSTQDSEKADARTSNAVAEITATLREVESRNIDRHNSILGGLKGIEKRLNGKH